MAFKTFWDIPSAPTPRRRGASSEHGAWLMRVLGKCAHWECGGEVTPDRPHWSWLLEPPAAHVSFDEIGSFVKFCCHQQGQQWHKLPSTTLPTPERKHPRPARCWCLSLWRHRASYGVMHHSPWGLSLVTSRADQLWCLSQNPAIDFLSSFATECYH